MFRKDIEYTFSFEWTDVVAFLAALLTVMLITENNYGDLTKQFTSSSNGSFYYSVDSYFDTSIVTSIRRGSIYDASFEVNSPLNYQILGFLMPSLLANILNISSHQALWGLALPFYKMVAILLGYELCFYFLRDRVSRNNYWFIFLSMSLPILLAPLHPLYVVKGVIKNFIFNGAGYLVPAGTITYPVTIILLLFCLLLFSKITWTDRKISGDKFFFMICLSLMVIGKVPLFASFVIFIGVVVLKRIILDREHIMNYFGYLAGSAIISGVLFKLCYGHSSAGKSYLEYGYYSGIYAKLIGIDNKGLLNNLAIVAVIISLYFIWIGARAFGLIALYKSKVPKLKEMFIASIVSLLVMFVLASFLHLEILDKNGNLLVDGTFDVEQFVRSSFYVITVVSTLGVVYLVYDNVIFKKFKVAILFFICIWCCLSLTTIVHKHFLKEAEYVKNAWFDETYSELKSGRLNDGLIAVNPGISFYGIMLAGSDFGRYWCAMGRPEGDNCSVKNEYRWDIFRNLLDSPRKEYLVQMKKEGVKYLISTPVDSAKLSDISKLYSKYIHKIQGERWTYEIE